MWRMQSIPQLFPITIGKSPYSHGAFTLPHIKTQFRTELGFAHSAMLQEF